MRRAVPDVDIIGVRFNVEQCGSGPPLVLLHGFTGSAASWAEHAQVFGTSFTTYAIDLIGHGRMASQAAPERYRMERCVQDLVALLDRLEVASTSLLGYSMGGRVALHLAVAAPERIEALVLESASPGIADPAERAARVRADEALADSIERDGLGAFVDRWERLPLFASQERLPEEVRRRHRAQRLSHDPRGLANSLRGMGAGAMEPAWERLSTLVMPVLLLAGELDEKYVALAREMERRIPHASSLIVPNAGHAVHLEAPEVYDQAVLGWLVKVMVAR